MKSIYSNSWHNMKLASPNKTSVHPKCSLLEGDIHGDERGNVCFVNAFDFHDIKRFYVVQNSNTHPIRAFHGHKKEGKYVYVVSGSALLCAVYVDDFDHPSKKSVVERYMLSDKKSQILSIPPHFANGWKALEENTKVIFFSTSTLEASLNDDFRFPYDYWGAEVWDIPNK